MPVIISHVLEALQEYKNITRKRLKYLQGLQPQLDQFTVLVRAIPKCKDRSYDEQVEFFFSNYHRQTYLLHHMVYDDRKMHKMLVSLMFQIMLLNIHMDIDSSQHPEENAALF